MTSKQARQAVLFDPGHVVATPGALTALAAAHQNAVHFLARYLRGYLGDVDAADSQTNDHALTHHGRLLSADTLNTGSVYGSSRSGIVQQQPSCCRTSTSHSALDEHSSWTGRELAIGGFPSFTNPDGVVEVQDFMH